MLVQFFSQPFHRNQYQVFDTGVQDFNKMHVQKLIADFFEWQVFGMRGLLITTQNNRLINIVLLTSFNNK